MACKECEELLAQAKDALRSHIEASSRVSDAVIQGLNIDIDGLEKLAAICREARKAAVKRYSDHIRSHQDETKSVATGATDTINSE